MPGPVPNAEKDLTRPRSRRGKDNAVVKGVRQTPTIPGGDPTWAAPVLRFYESLKTSGQSDFYQSSDWAMAYMLCDQMNQHYLAGMRSSEMFKGLMSGISNLLVSEADRRRVRLELQEPKPEGPTAAVAAIDDYRKALGAG